MGAFNGTVFSRSLKMDVRLSVILPQDSRKHRGVEPLAEGMKPAEKPGTLFLLHGLGDNHSAWLNKTAVYRYAEEYDTAVIMPEAHRSFYQNMHSGQAFETYITEELPELCSHLFHISTKPEDLMIAGLSMGGYGSLYYGLKYPEKFCAIGSFSGAVDIVNLAKTSNLIDREDLAGKKDMEYAFGNIEAGIGREYDIYYLLEQVMKKDKKPPIYLTVGKADPLCPFTRALAEKLSEYGYHYQFDLLEGAHDWDVWDPSVYSFIKQFALKKT